ncbi:unnamed protein product, partial [Citrullus colocynthis]
KNDDGRPSDAADDLWYSGAADNGLGIEAADDDDGPPADNADDRRRCGIVEQQTTMDHRQTQLMADDATDDLWRRFRVRDLGNCFGR